MFGAFGKMRTRKIFTPVREQIFPELSEPDRGESDNRWPRKTHIRYRACTGTSLVQDSLRKVTCFGDCVFWSAGTPDAHRAMPPQGCGAQKHPGGACGTAQGPEEFHVPCNATGSKVILNDLNVTSRKTIYCFFFSYGAGLVKCCARQRVKNPV